MNHAGQVLFRIAFDGLLQLRREDGSFVRRSANWMLWKTRSLFPAYVAAHFMCWRDRVNSEEVDFIKSRMGRVWIYGMSTGELREIGNMNVRDMKWNETDERVCGYIMFREGD